MRGGGCVCIHSIYKRPPPGVIIGPIIPHGSAMVGRASPLFWTKLTRCDVNFYGVNMAAFLNTQVLISDGTKGGSFACGVVYVTEVEWHQ